MLATLARLPVPFGAVLGHRNDKAFAEEAAGLRPLVRAVVASVLREALGHPDVEDCTNETLKRALEGHARLFAGETPRAWVVGIARHVALDTLRARRRTRSRTEQDITEQGDEQRDPTPLVERVADPSDDPFERVAKARRDQAVRSAIARLPDGPRRALTMFHLEGLGYQDIAERLAVPLGTVATWVMRGRKAIAAAVADLVRDS